MPKKPVIITVITLCFLIAPLAIIMQASVFTNTPVIGPYNIFQKLSVTDWMVICIYAASAAAVYSVKKWGWYLYIACALILVIYNCTVFILRPRYSVLIMIVFNLALFAVAGVFFRRTVITPYFNPSLRWWQQPSRYKINLSMTVGGRIGRKPSTCDIVDISSTGAFVVSPEELEHNADYHIVVQCLRHTASLTGKIVREAAFRGKPGYGIRFLEHNDAVIKELGAMLRDLKRAGLVSPQRSAYRGPVAATPPAPRYTLHIDALVAMPKGEYTAHVADISRGGCLLAAENGFCPPLDQPCRITIRFGNRELKLDAVSRWQSNSNHTPACGYAFNFHDKNEAKDILGIIRIFHKAGAIDRLEIAKPLSKEDLLPFALKSPYKILHGIRSRLTGR